MKTNYLIILILSLSINLFGNEKYYSPEAFNNEISSENLFIEELNADLNANVSEDVVSFMIDSAKSKVINSPIVCVLSNDDTDVFNTSVEWKLLNTENSPINPQIENNKSQLLVTIKGETMNFSANRFQIVKILTFLYGIRNSDNTISDMTVSIMWTTHKENKRWLLQYSKIYD